MGVEEDDGFEELDDTIGLEPVAEELSCPSAVETLLVG